MNNPVEDKNGSVENVIRLVGDNWIRKQMYSPSVSEPRRAFYVGRFQMLHHGHLGVLKFIESQDDVDEIVVGIGSSQYSRYNKSFEAPLLVNPFTFEERKAYVEKVFKDNLKKPYKICGIMDQHDHERWVKYTFTVVPKISYIYTNASREIEAFSKAGYECRRFPLSDNYNATLIRELMANDGPWEKFVPAAVADVIKEKQLDKIVKELFASNPKEVEGIHENRIRRGELSYEDFILQTTQTK